MPEIPFRFTEVVFLRPLLRPHKVMPVLGNSSYHNKHTNSSITNIRNVLRTTIILTVTNTHIRVINNTNMLCRTGTCNKAIRYLNYILTINNSEIIITVKIDQIRDNHFLKDRISIFVRITKHLDQISLVLDSNHQLLSTIL